MINKGHDNSKNLWTIPWSKIALIIADIVALAIALALSFLLRSDFDIVQAFGPTYGFPYHLISLPFAIIVYIGIFSLNRLYRYAWRFASLDMLRDIVISNAFGLTAMVAIQAIFERSIYPRAVLLIFFLLSIFMVGGMRIVLRLLHIRRSQGENTSVAIPSERRRKHVVIMGGGPDGARLLEAIQEDMNDPIRVIGFLDDDVRNIGVYIRGVKVLGPLKYLYTLLTEQLIDEVLIRIPEASVVEIKEYVMACRKQKIPVKVIPAMCDVVSGQTQFAHLEDVSVEDLLRRPPVTVDLGGICGYLTGKCVLVTGAGGSIGSELCRQIITMDPSTLVLFGHGENSIHNIYQELKRNFPEQIGRVKVVIGSVADDVRIGQIFQMYSPKVVFHAAAHKHVPIMEINVPEAVQNNVMGTRCVAEACGRYSVECMVLISTDKAVTPSSVMGATKWLCEEAVRYMAQHYLNTKYLTVRFGNVLGSRGSVVPIFTEQILRGGPVTVTHPEMTRFFMTIPEAVLLVLQAGAVGTSGELYLLDMGKPVKIVDLARDMIRLSGLEPEVNIKIEFTGLRSGEKLHEVLSSGDEIKEESEYERLSRVRRQVTFEGEEYREVLRTLQQKASAGDPAELLAYLDIIVPGFAQQRLLSDTILLPENVSVVR